MITVEASNKYWNYYLALENDLEKLSRYIEFDKENFGVYSVELAHLLLASASEVDVVMKDLCKLLSPFTNAEKIHEYQSIIKEKLPQLYNETIYISRYGISVQPWSYWSDEKSSNWWRGYNKVKHERDTHFNKANLQHTINALGALLITNYYYYKTVFEQENGSEMKPKLVTEKLQHKFPFVKLSDEYYYDTLVV